MTQQELLDQAAELLAAFKQENERLRAENEQLREAINHAIGFLDTSPLSRVVA